MIKVKVLSGDFHYAKKTLVGTIGWVILDETNFGLNK